MIRSAVLSDVGCKRQTNQDSYVLNSQNHIYLLADGMGGYAGGSVASKITVTTIEDFMTVASDSQESTWPFGYDQNASYEQNVLKTAILLANLRVSKAAEETEHYAGMGSTAVAVWLRNNAVFYAHVGDSRLYLLRNDQLRQLTEDHSVVQEQLKRGIISQQEAQTHTLRHVVTRAIGSRERFPVDVQQLSLNDNDQFLLCSDGLTDAVQNQTIQQILLAAPDLDSACRELVRTANEASGEDNITVVLLKYSV